MSARRRREVGEPLSRKSGVDLAVAPAEKGVVTLTGGLELEDAPPIRPCRIAYEWVGAADAPTVVVLGGISADGHVASHQRDPEPGWWEPFVGPGKGLATDDYRVLAVDWVGGPGGSSAPAEAPGPHGIASVTTFDQAAAVAATLDRLGVDRVRGFVGASYGGMVALAFGAWFPERVERIVAISAAHESHPMATALRSLQRRIALFGLETGRPRDGLVLARALAMTTYRSDREFRERFSGAPHLEGGLLEFPVEGYLKYQGEKFADRSRLDHFLFLCQSLDLHSVEPEEIPVSTTLVSVEEDRLVPPWQMRELRDRLAGDVELVSFSSLYGHDAFLKEEERMTALLRRLFPVRDER